MKKKLLLHFAMAIFLFAGSCSRPTEWSVEQRAEFVESMDPYREMVYLNELSAPEFVVFATDLGSDFEVAYPVYTEFMVLPALSDTIERWVVRSIVEELDTDAYNMRYLYPYRTLVAEGVLPEGMNHESRMSFYSCLAQKVNNHFTTLESFFYAALTNSLEPNIISTMQAECGSNFLVITEIP